VTRAGKRSGMVNLGGWVASWGQKPRESVCVSRMLATGIPGQTLKWGLSLRKVTSSGQDGCLRVEYREVGGTTWRERATNEALDRRDVFARQVNHTRGARTRSDARNASSRYS